MPSVESSCPSAICLRECHRRKCTGMHCPMQDEWNMCWTPWRCPVEPVLHHYTAGHEGTFKCLSLCLRVLPSLKETHRLSNQSEPNRHQMPQNHWQLHGWKWDVSTRILLPLCFCYLVSLSHGEMTYQPCTHIARSSPVQQESSELWIQRHADAIVNFYPSLCRYWHVFYCVYLYLCRQI